MLFLKVVKDRQGGREAAILMTRRLTGAHLDPDELPSQLRTYRYPNPPRQRSARPTLAAANHNTCREVRLDRSVEHFVEHCKYLQKRSSAEQGRE